MMNLLKFLAISLVLICLANTAFTEENKKSLSGTSDEKTTQTLNNPSQNFSVSFVGVYGITQANASNETNYYGYNNRLDRTSRYENSRSGSAFGLGVLTEAKLTPNLGIEMGLFYLPRKVSESDASLSMKSIMITPMARLYVVPEYLSLGIGGFVSHGIGKVELKEKYPRDLDTVSYKNTNLKKLNWGAAAAIGATAPIDTQVSILLEMRYLYGISSADNEETYQGFSQTKTKVRMNDIQAMTGLKFNL